MIDTKAIDIGGPHDARTVIFLHAASYTRKMWLPQFRALSGEFRVVSFDMRGHGKRSGIPFDFDGCVDDVEATVVGLGMGPALFVGASLGGCIAMEMAARRPDLVAGLVLGGATFDARTPLCRLVLTCESVVFPRIEARLVRHFQEYVRSTLPTPMANEIVEAGSYWRAAAAAVAQMRGRNFVGSLRAFEGPTLIVNGRRDWVHRFYERRFLRAARDGSVTVIDGANHICSLDAPDEFSDCIRACAERCHFPVLQREGE